MPKDLPPFCIVVVAERPDRAEFEILPDGRLKLSQGGHALFFVRK